VSLKEQESQNVIHTGACACAVLCILRDCACVCVLKRVCVYVQTCLNIFSILLLFFIFSLYFLALSFSSLCALSFERNTFLLMRFIYLLDEDYYFFLLLRHVCVFHLRT
jgi:hypothetical protein